MNLTETARETLAQHTVAELRDLAREAGIVGRSRMRKAELVEALLPTQVAEMDLVAANRRASLVPADGSLVRAAINAKDAYLEVVARCGQENGGFEVSAAWEDYLDACVAAETCTRTDCWDRATDGDGRCGRHSHGAPLGQDVVSRETEAEEATPAPSEGQTIRERLGQLPTRELREIAASLTISHRSGMAREQLIAALAGHPTTPAILPAPADEPTGSSEPREQGFGVTTVSINGGESTWPERFATVADAKREVRYMTRGLTSIWRAWVLDSNGNRVSMGTRNGRSASGRNWAWQDVK